MDNFHLFSIFFMNLPRHFFYQHFAVSGVPACAGHLAVAGFPTSASVYALAAVPTVAGKMLSGTVDRVLAIAG
jgi:hypothetical protein